MQWDMSEYRRSAEPLTAESVSFTLLEEVDNTQGDAQPAVPGAKLSDGYVLFSNV